MGTDAENSGKFGDALAAIEERWMKDAALMTYGECVGKKLSGVKLAEWTKKSATLSHSDAVALAKSMGVNVYWDWDVPRTREGYYRSSGGTDYSIARCIQFAPYCDLLWMETPNPTLSQAEKFSKGVLGAHPWAKLAYNLSPSFNWDAAGLSDAQMETY